MAITEAGTRLQFPMVDSANTGTVSSAVTVPATAEIVIVKLSLYQGTNAGAAAMTFTKGGTDAVMTKVTGDDATNAQWQGATFWQVLPDTGANKVLKWDWIGTGASSDASWNVSMSFWNGIDTASPVRDSDGAQASNTPISTKTLTALSGDLIWVGVSGFNTIEDGSGSIDSWTNATELAEVPHNHYAEITLATHAPSGNVAITAATSTNLVEVSISAIVLKAAAAAAGQTPYNPWPQRGPILAQKRKGFIGWNPLHDHRRRVLRPDRALLVPARKIILPGRKAA